MKQGLGLAALCLVTLVGLSACGGGGSSSGPGFPHPQGGAGTGGSGSTPQSPPPDTLGVTASANTVVPGDEVTLSAASLDPQGDPLTYSWDFGDGTTATGATVTHIYPTAGVYVVRAVGTDQHSATFSGSTDIVVSKPILFYYTNNDHILGQVFKARILLEDPKLIWGPPTWDFGDGTVGGYMSIVEHQYAAPGTYSVTVSVSDRAHHSIAAHTTVHVGAPATPPPLRDNELAAYCSGAFCGAVDANTYSGSGVGIWRYHNSTSASATVDISIHGVNTGQNAVLIFSNGLTVAAPELPGAGTLAEAAQLGPHPSMRMADRSTPGRPSADHIRILRDNNTFARQLLATARPPTRTAALAIAQQAAHVTAPSVGTIRTWTDIASDRTNPTSYAMQVAATCALEDGRNAVFWLDAAQLSSGAVTTKDAEDLAERFCGARGAYARLTAVVGSPYGSAAKVFPGFIQDSPAALQDINIVIPGVPEGTYWAGYYSQANLNLKSLDPHSNEALAVYLNGTYMARTSSQGVPGGQALRGDLFHELQHLINFYQRTLVRGAVHAEFLEETSALLAEDYIEPALISEFTDWVGSYADDGAGISYIGWQTSNLSRLSRNYGLGGAVGAFLHRQFGLAVDRELISTCPDAGDPLSSYQCLDQLIQRHGGVGFEDYFARIGASVFGMMPMSGTPEGFGFPNRTFEGYGLDTPLSLGSPLIWVLGKNANPLTDGFLPTSHTYQLDSIGTGQTTYSRTGVQVPAGTTMVVVIDTPQPPIPF